MPMNTYSRNTLKECDPRLLPCLFSRHYISMGLFQSLLKVMSPSNKERRMERNWPSCVQPFVTSPCWGLFLCYRWHSPTCGAMTYSYRLQSLLGLLLPSFASCIWVVPQVNHLLTQVPSQSINLFSRCLASQEPNSNGSIWLTSLCWSWGS